MATLLESRALTHRNRTMRRGPSIYCVVPRELSPELSEELREEWRDDPSLHVVVERRAGERRDGERRGGEGPAPDDGERRRIRGALGRRIAERRALAAPATPPVLPPAAEPYAERLVFVELLEQSERRAEDAESDRLVTGFQAGHAEAFEELYLRYFDRVYGYLRVSLHDPHEAEDIAQNVFASALAALPEYEVRIGMPFRAWLFRIARNALLNALPRQRRTYLEEPAQVDERRAASVADGDVAGALGWLSDADIFQFVERLPLSQRQVLVMRYMLDLTTEDIAAALDRTPKAVRQLQARACKTLQERMTAIGRGPVSPRRAAMLIRLRPAPVLAARRFALGFPTRLVPMSSRPAALR